MRYAASLLILYCVVSFASTADAVEVRRFALLVGANDGGEERPRLRFAESDARAMGSVLSDMGGVARADEVYVLAPGPAELDAAFQKIRKKLRAAKEEGVRLELIAYYSGHSDEFGLLLGGERYDYPRFREELESLPADVRIIVVDSCASGALIRSKGGTLRPGFLEDASSDVKGQAIVTSSSIDEAAQESDDLGSSYFTHFLVSGLRGAADRNADSRVTLAEAYEYAFSNTLQVTNGTAGGAQHPTYDFQLSGHGEVVLTMFTPTTSTLELGEDVVGRIYVWTEAERLAVEVPKAYGTPLELGLTPGKYTVTLAQNGEARRADVELPEVGRRRLELGDFRFYELAQARTRGDREEPTETLSVEARPRPRLPWYRLALLPTAAVGIATTVASIAVAGHARKQEDIARQETYDADRAGDLDAAYQHLDEALYWRRRAGTARTVGVIGGSVAAAALLTEAGFRLFGSEEVAFGLRADGGVWARIVY